MISTTLFFDNRQLMMDAKTSRKAGALALVWIMALAALLIPANSENQNKGEVRCIESERKALLKFKKGLTHYGDLSEIWRTEECCNWKGVTCSNTTGHVDALNLSMFSIAGEISPALLELTHLSHLDLSENDFMGSRIPEFIGSMKQLEYLSLSNSHFSGMIPPQLGNLTNLHTLNLNFNEFMGSRIPEFIGSMNQLEYLSLMGSDFSGMIPPQLGNLTNLHKLDLSYNHFMGSRIPEFIGSMNQLEYLSLRGSDFSGMIPPQLGNLTNLHTLYLSFNQFMGSRIPEFIGSMNQLEYLSLRGSNFSGMIPPQLGNLTNLHTLDLSGNSFTRIPEFICSMKQLEYLFLKNSNFSGMIPPQLGNLTNLGTLDLSYNFLWFEDLSWLSSLSHLYLLDLSGSNISDTNWIQPIMMLPSLQELHLPFCNLADVVPSPGLFANSSSTSLYFLDLANNNLTSSVVDWLFNISTSLTILDLSHNKLTGPIPDSFGRSVTLLNLDLSHNKLQGSLLSCLGQLSKLRYLYVSFNSLEGAIYESHVTQGPVPDLGACSELRILDVRSNGLTGPLPAILGKLSKLEELYISDNSLEGTVTEANFLELRNLKTLDLSLNSLTLDLSPDWIPPFHLHRINLAACKISGSSFPLWLQTQNDSWFLDISLAGILGEVPKWVWNMSNIIYLNLSHNQISGTIPDFPSTSFMTMLDVSYNNLSGPVPFLHPEFQILQMSFNMFSGSISSICPYAFCQIQWLDVSKNQLEGALPSDWENMKDLVILNVNYNNLSGEIPHTLGSLSNLQTLHLRGNKFSGELPSTLKSCKLLQQIDIGENRFTGNIPSWLGENHTSLAFLSLSRNMFYGDIPPEICRLSQIQLLDLSENSLTGRIPKCFDNFTALVDKNMTTNTRIYVLKIATDGYMDYALVQWKGQRAEYNRILGLLKLVDLSSNKLVGSIPESFSNLKGLISLNLSRNGLTGNIIPGIGEMETLETLDLSSNRFSGKIPVGLAQLNYLAVLDLANNNLSGEIPQSTQLIGFNASAYAGNNGLCGRPLPLCVNTSISTDQGDDSDEEDSWFTSLSSTQEFCITLALGFIVGFWGVVGSLVLKRSWRCAFFNFFDAVGNRLFVTATAFLHKFRRS